jgi:hypothetical protein
MFIAALFAIAKLWKQPRCPTIDEWMKKMWYLCTLEVIKKNEKNFKFTGKWVELENIMLRKGSQAQKDTGHLFSLICGREIQKTNVYTKTNMIIYTYICVCVYIYIQNMFPIVGLYEVTRGRGREKQNDRMNNNQMHCICVGRSYKETQ